MHPSTQATAALIFITAALTPSANAQLETDGAATLDVIVSNPSYIGCSDPIFDFDQLDCFNLPPSVPQAGYAFTWVDMAKGEYLDEGLLGARFGLYHTLQAQPGETGLTWTLCTGGDEMPSPAWPALGSGNAVTWPTCFVPATDVAKIGYLAVGTADQGCVDVHTDPRIGHATYTTCTPEEYLFRPICLFGHRDLSEVDITCNDCGVGDPGNLCGAVPVERSTWTRIKQSF